MCRVCFLRKRYTHSEHKVILSYIAMEDVNMFSVFFFFPWLQIWGSLLTRTKHKNYRIHWGTERFIQYLEVSKGQIHWWRDRGSILNPQKKKKAKNKCIIKPFWEHVWIDGRAHAKRQSFHFDESNLPSVL